MLTIEGWRVQVKRDLCTTKRSSTRYTRWELPLGKRRYAILRSIRLTKKKKKKKKRRRRRHAPRYIHHLDERNASFTHRPISHHEVEEADAKKKKKKKKKKTTIRFDSI